MNDLHEWELIDEQDHTDDFRVTSRMRVPGGWLYKIETHVNLGHDRKLSTALQYVPCPEEFADPAHLGKSKVRTRG